MSEQTTDQILPAESAFVTVTDAIARLSELADLAPAGGSLFGITVTHRSRSILSTPENDAGTQWRIGVTIEVPRFANLLFGQLACWGVPGSCKRIEFVVKAEADAVTIGADGQPKRKGHKYTVLNGSFQMKHHLSTEMEHAVPFHDPKVRMWYGSTYDSTDFAEALKVIRSEITGEPAFPELG